MDYLIKNSNKPGFTLTELAIVIIIIGLLIAGISGGRALIKQAKLQSIITDMQAYHTAFVAFSDQYNLPPGDLNNAASFWPSNCGATDDACNGNGNGTIDAHTDNTDEVAAAWKHLQLSGFINYNLAIVPDVPVAFEIGVNVPDSSIEGAGYALGSNNVIRDTNYINWSWNVFTNNLSTNNNINFIYFGKPDPDPRTLFTGLKALTYAAISPLDAFNIDAKIDDGSIDSNGNFLGPVSGIFRSMSSDDKRYTGCLTAFGTFNAHYKGSVTEEECTIAMQMNK